MRPKPKHLGPEYGSQFRDPTVVESYRLRPAYPEETIGRLLDLLPEAPRTILDAGCGPGNLARRLAPRVDRVDAVDISEGMIERGRVLPGGDHPHLRWIRAPMEEAPLEPPYGLVTAGQSLHWMEWDVVLPRLRDALAPGLFLAIVGNWIADPPWQAELLTLIARYSTNQDYVPYDIVEELESRDLFRPVGEHESAPVRHRGTVDEYVEALHSGNGFSLDRMELEAACAFDRAVKRLVEPCCPDGVVTTEVRGRIHWGRPLPLPDAR